MSIFGLTQTLEGPLDEIQGCGIMEIESKAVKPSSTGTLCRI